MNPAILRAPRGSRRSASVPPPSSVVTRDALKQLRLHGAVDDLPRRWERIVQQGQQGGRA